MFSSSRTHAPWLKFDGHPRACGLFTLILLFYFLLYLPPLFLFLNYLKSVVNLHNFCNESMDSTDEFSLSTEEGGGGWRGASRLREEGRGAKGGGEGTCVFVCVCSVGVC